MSYLSQFLGGSAGVPIGGTIVGPPTNSEWGSWGPRLANDSAEFLASGFLAEYSSQYANPIRLAPHLAVRGTQGHFSSTNSVVDSTSYWVKVVPDQTGRYLVLGCKSTFSGVSAYKSLVGPSGPFTSISPSSGQTVTLSTVGGSANHSGRTCILGGGGGWVAFAYSSTDTGAIYTSSNGITWTNRADTLGGSGGILVGAGTGWCYIGSSAGLYRNIANSNPDGTWSTPTVTNGPHNTALFGLTGHAVGGGGYVVAGYFSATPVLRYSSDLGATWTNSTLPSGWSIDSDDVNAGVYIGVLRTMAYLGGSSFCMIGAHGLNGQHRRMVSTNGGAAWSDAGPVVGLPALDRTNAKNMIVGYDGSGKLWMSGFDSSGDNFHAFSSDSGATWHVVNTSWLDGDLAGGAYNYDPFFGAPMQTLYCPVAEAWFPQRKYTPTSWQRHLFPNVLASELPPDGTPRYVGMPAATYVDYDGTSSRRVYVRTR